MTDEEAVDEALDDSFPASDPPPWTGGHPGGPRDLPTEGAPKSPGRDDDGKIVKSGKEARQGKIVLDTPRKRWIFIGGLAGIAVVVALAATAG